MYVKSPFFFCEISYNLYSLFSTFFLCIIILLFFFECRCQLPNELENATYNLPHEIMNMSYPFDYKTNTWSSCEMYDTNFTNLYYLSKIPANQSKHCDNWIYDKSKTNSAVVEVNTMELTSLKVVI